ncbi:ribosome silencing factor [bacterium]|nr:ribosome silencing factor [bacterium]
MLEKQADDVIIIDLHSVSSIADYFVIGTGSVDVHLKAIVDYVEKSVYEHEDAEKPYHVEGMKNARWVLLDYGNVVAHVFLPETRHFYQLETLWGDVPLERFIEAS